MARSSSSRNSSSSRSHSYSRIPTQTRPRPKTPQQTPVTTQTKPKTPQQTPVPTQIQQQVPTTINLQPRPSFLSDIARTASGVFIGNMMTRAIFGNGHNMNQQKIENELKKLNGQCDDKFNIYKTCIMEKEQEGNLAEGVCSDELQKFTDCYNTYKSK